jgi:hypothetical protein
MKLIPNFYETFVKCNFSLRETARLLGINRATAKRNYDYYIQNNSNSLSEQLASANQLAIKKQIEKLAEGNDKALDRQFKHAIQPILERELEAKFSTQNEAKSNVSKGLISLVNDLENKLTPYQRNFYEAPQRFKGILSSTKAGKTFYCIFEVLKSVSELSTSEICWWCAPTYKVAKIAFRRVLKLLDSKAIQYKANKSDFEIVFEHGAIIQFKSADNADNLYGEDVHYAAVDEFTRMSGESWVAIQSTLTATNGKATLIGNYTTSSNWGVKMVQNLAQKNPTNWAYFTVTIWEAVEAGVVDRAVAEQAKQDLHPFVFDALYLVKGSHDELALVNILEVSQIFKTTQPRGVRYITADIALMGADLFVCMVWEGLNVIAIRIREKCDGEEVVNFIKDLKEEFAVEEKNIVFDSDGVGGYLGGYFKDAFPFNGNKGGSKVYQNQRSHFYFYLSQLIRNGKIAVLDLAYETQITEELLAIKSSAKDTEGKLAIIKKEQIRKELGRSTDFADCLMMRMLFEVFN